MSHALRPQAWAFLGSVGAAVLTVGAALGRHFPWALLWSLVAVGLWVTSRHWNRDTPGPFPYTFRWFLRLPRPGHSPRQLARILQPRGGEHLLEIGPGIGTHALPIASALVPDGVLDVLDVQQEMLEAVRRRARAAGIANIIGCVGDAAHLPYPDGWFDGAYLIGVLGEIPDGDGTLRELARVLKPTGRLVVGELLIDPDFIPFRRLQTRAEQAGFTLQRKTGSAVAYLARFEPHDRGA